MLYSWQLIYDRDQLFKHPDSFSTRPKPLEAILTLIQQFICSMCLTKVALASVCELEANYNESIYFMFYRTSVTYNLCVINTVYANYAMENKSHSHKFKSFR